MSLLWVVLLSSAVLCLVGLSFQETMIRFLENPIKLNANKARFGKVNWSCVQLSGGPSSSFGADPTRGGRSRTRVSIPRMLFCTGFARGRSLPVVSRTVSVHGCQWRSLWDPHRPDPKQYKLQIGRDNLPHFLGCFILSGTNSTIIQKCITASNTGYNGYARVWSSRSICLKEQVTVLRKHGTQHFAATTRDLRVHQRWNDQTASAYWHRESTSIGKAWMGCYERGRW